MAQRNATFDIMKGMGILLVVAAHTYEGGLRALLTGFLMPLFFIVSGHFYKLRPLSEQLKQDTRRLLLPYLLIVVSTMLAGTLKDLATGHEARLFLSTLYDCTTPAWFLPALFGARAIFNIVLRHCKHYLLVSFAVSSVPTLLAFYVQMPTFLSIASAVNAVIFVAVGYAFRQQQWEQALDRHLPVAALVAAVSWFVSATWSDADIHFCKFSLWVADYLGVCGATYLFFLTGRLIDKHAAKTGRVLALLGFYSFVIYSYHAIEYSFPSWHQLIPVTDTALRTHCIYLCRVVMACLATYATTKIGVLRRIYFYK